MVVKNVCSLKVWWVSIEKYKEVGSGKLRMSEAETKMGRARHGVFSENFT